MSTSDPVGERDFDNEQTAIRKAFWRLIPFALLLYLVAYLDRINIGFAALTMNADLGITATLFGLAITAFYIPFALLEVPSNMMLARFGTRIWIPRIMIVWGFASAATMFATGPYSLMALRALVGAAEAGFFPGVLYYLSLWFPRSHLARANALFIAALPLAAVIGSPLSAVILQMDGISGLAGWQWLFVLEGLPAVGLGIVAYFYLPNTPADARWLSSAEKLALNRQIQAEAGQAPASAQPPANFWRHFWKRNIILISGVYFCLAASSSTLGFWTPQIVRESLQNTDQLMLIGVVSAGPALLGVIAMFFFSASSDKHGERLFYILGLVALSAIGWAAIAVSDSASMKIGGLVVCTVGAYSTMAIFWAFAGQTLAPESKAIGIAVISVAAALAAIVSPVLVGFLRDLTQDFSASAWYAAIMSAMAVTILWAFRRGLRQGST